MSKPKKRVSCRDRKHPTYVYDDPESVDPRDRTIWISTDKDRTSALPWKLGDYGDDGVFSDEEIHEFALRHDLPEESASKLSVTLGYCLAVDSILDATKVNRAVALKRAGEQTKKAHNAAKRGDFPAAVALIAKLADRFGSEPAQSDALAEAKRLADDPQTDPELMLEALRRLRNTPEAAFDMSPRDGRKVWDSRRKTISWQCCYLFQELERPITYWTDGSKRGGALIDLIEDVVRRVTEPSMSPGSETIRRDIDLFRTPISGVYYGDDPRSEFLR